VYAASCNLIKYTIKLHSTVMMTFSGNGNDIQSVGAEMKFESNDVSSNN